ncbi:MAG: PLD nuclease N-terminal domain-containing protein [Actinomycetota bacterium]|nr:PLD nuclease N-terminal domain-containing protein [Actinomycetota bacterium]
MFFDGLLGVLLLGLWVYCIFDVISTDETAVQNLPKSAWLFIVIILPDVGSLAWLILGRPYGVSWRPGGVSAGRSHAPTERAPRRRPMGPEDSPEFIAKIDSDQAERLRRWEADLAAREADLRRKAQEESDE